MSPMAGGVLADTAEWASAVEPFTRIVKPCRYRAIRPETARAILAMAICTAGANDWNHWGRASGGTTFIRNPPGALGGNMDCRDVREGVTIYFNCYNDGGLLSIGDVHCMQGAGELTGCACDVPPVQITCEVIKDKTIRGIRLETDDSIIAMGIERPLERSVAMATSNLMHWLVTEYELSPRIAYMLISISPLFNLNVYQMIPSARIFASLSGLRSQSRSFFERGRQAVHQHIHWVPVEPQRLPTLRGHPRRCHSARRLPEFSMSRTRADSHGDWGSSCPTPLEDRAWKAAVITDRQALQVGGNDRGGA